MNFNADQNSLNNFKPELSVVILCYRAEESIIPFISKMEAELKKDNINYELVLVANYHPGIPDKTSQIVTQLSENNYRITPVVKEKQGMMGWDLRSGLEAARGETIAFIDGDGQMPSIDVVRLYRVFRSGEFDMCKTYRIKRMDARWRQVISVIYNLSFNILFPGLYIHDINSKPKIISRKAYGQMKLTNDNWFADGEIMLEARRLKLTIGEIPTVFYMHRWKKTFVKPITILEFIKNLLFFRFKYWFMKKNGNR